MGRFGAPFSFKVCGVSTKLGERPGTKAMAVHAVEKNDLAREPFAPGCE
jgi:hypothetical protein